MSYPKPVLVVSACLAGENVRYDGKPVENEFSRKLLRYVEPVKVCPEIELGLGVPREKVVVYRDGRIVKLYQPATGLDLTGAMERFSKEFLDSLPKVDGFLLKAKSPSCGVSRTKTYRDPAGKRFVGFGKGLFAERVMERFPYLPVEDELTLRKERRRLVFLTALFSFALIRVEGREFHSRIGDSLKYFTPALERKMRTIRDREDYRKLLMRALKRLPYGVLEGFEFVPSELKTFKEV